MLCTSWGFRYGIWHALFCPKEAFDGHVKKFGWGCFHNASGVLNLENLLDEVKGLERNGWQCHCTVVAEQSLQWCETEWCPECNLRGRRRLSQPQWFQLGRDLLSGLRKAPRPVSIPQSPAHAPYVLSKAKFIYYRPEIPLWLTFMQKRHRLCRFSKTWGKHRISLQISHTHAWPWVLWVILLSEIGLKGFGPPDSRKPGIRFYLDLAIYKKFHIVESTTKPWSLEVIQLLLVNPLTIRRDQDWPELRLQRLGSLQTFSAYPSCKPAGFQHQLD